MAGPTRQQNDHRRHRRQPVHYPAWMVFGPGQPPQRCMLSDISTSGAKIMVDDDLDPPPEFKLLLSAKDNKPRTCRIVWRDGPIVGIEFLV
jgi:hypothetical protein